jgi:NTP pyrophosphatase (non-canonical NTP hydrolase)
MNKKAELNLKSFREINTQRAVEGFKTYRNVPLSFWGTALAGELGELCNMIKKIERVKMGGIDAGNSYKASDITPAMLEDEFGGIFIYLDLLASLLDVDLEKAIIETFNSKSEQYGFVKYDHTTSLYFGQNLSGVNAQGTTFSAGTSEESPLKPFADSLKSMPNPKDQFAIGRNIFKEGDNVFGTWVDFDGRTFYQNGTIISNPVTGLWVESLDGGITEVKRFLTMDHDKSNK